MKNYGGEVWELIDWFGGVVSGKREGAEQWLSPPGRTPDDAARRALALLGIHDWEKYDKGNESR
jgi:hypothetical protein